MSATTSLHIEELREQIRILKAALAPFAAVADEADIFGTHPDTTWLWKPQRNFGEPTKGVLLRDVLNAREVMKGIE